MIVKSKPVLIKEKAQLEAELKQLELDIQKIEAMIDDLNAHDAQSEEVSKQVEDLEAKQGSFLVKQTKLKKAIKALEEQIKTATNYIPLPPIKINFKDHDQTFLPVAYQRPYLKPLSDVTTFNPVVQDAICNKLFTIYQTIWDKPSDLTFTQKEAKLLLMDLLNQAIPIQDLIVIGCHLTLYQVRDVITSMQHHIEFLIMKEETVDQTIIKNLTQSYQFIEQQITQAIKNTKTHGEPMDSAKKLLSHQYCLEFLKDMKIFEQLTNEQTDQLAKEYKFDADKYKTIAPAKNTKSHTKPEINDPSFFEDFGIPPSTLQTQLLAQGKNCDPAYILLEKYIKANKIPYDQLQHNKVKIVQELKTKSIHEASTFNKLIQHMIPPPNPSEIKLKFEKWATNHLSIPFITQHADIVIDQFCSDNFTTENTTKHHTFYIKQVLYPIVKEPSKLNIVNPVNQKDDHTENEKKKPRKWVSYVDQIDAGSTLIKDNEKGKNEKGKNEKEENQKVDVDPIAEVDLQKLLHKKVPPQKIICGYTHEYISKAEQIHKLHTLKPIIPASDWDTLVIEKAANSIQNGRPDKDAPTKPFDPSNAPTQAELDEGCYKQDTSFRTWEGKWNWAFRMEKENKSRYELCIDPIYPHVEDGFECDQWNYPDDMPRQQDLDKSNPLLYIDPAPILTMRVMQTFYNVRALYHRPIRDPSKLISIGHYFKRYTFPEGIQFGRAKRVYTDDTVSPESKEKIQALFPYEAYVQQIIHTYNEIQYAHPDNQSQLYDLFKDINNNLTNLY
jgi:hypothetical protein